MEITFNKPLTEDIKSICKLELVDNGIIITNEVKNFFRDELSHDTSYLVDKKQLHDFIGALLHLQAKLKING